MRKYRAIIDSRRARARTKWVSKNKIYNDVMQLCNHEIRKTVYSLRDETIDYQIKNQLKKYLIVELVSVFEYYFKNMTAYYVDHNKVDLSILFEDTITFKLSELDSMLADSDSTRGDIIVSSLKFGDLDEVNSIVSKLLDIDLFEYLYKENKGNKYRMMVKGPPIDINYKNLYKAFELRHKYVHELGFGTYNYTKISNLWDNVMNMFDIANTIFMIPSLLQEFRQVYGRNKNFI